MLVGHNSAPSLHLLRRINVMAGVAREASSDSLPAIQVFTPAESAHAPEAPKPPKFAFIQQRSSTLSMTVDPTAHTHIAGFHLNSLYDEILTVIHVEH